MSEDHYTARNDEKQQPPSSNRGVSGKNYGEKVKYSVDWLTYSFPLPGDFSFWDASTGELRVPSGFIEPQHELFILTGKELRSFRGYTCAREMGAGRVDWHHENLTQGGLVTLTGKDCTSLHLAGIDVLSVLSHALYGLNGSITRLDFAIDIFASVNPQDIETAWKEQRVITSAKTAHPHPEYDQQGQLVGYTFYIGSGASERMLRVYDKAARERVPGSWVRIELQTRGAQAVALAKTMLINGVIAGGKAFVRDFIQVQGLSWFSEACSGSGGEFLEPVERKETDRQRWYREQIIPAIESDLAGGDGWLYFELQQAIDYSREVDAHGGVVSLKNSNKAFYGVKALTAEGFSGAEFRRAFERAGKEFICQLCEQLGYRWNTKTQRWQKGGD